MMPEAVMIRLLLAALVSLAPTLAHAGIIIGNG